MLPDGQDTPLDGCPGWGPPHPMSGLRCSASQRPPFLQGLGTLAAAICRGHSHCAGGGAEAEEGLGQDRAGRYLLVNSIPLWAGSGDHPGSLIFAICVLQQKAVLHHGPAGLGLDSPPWGPEDPGPQSTGPSGWQGMGFHGIPGYETAHQDSDGTFQLGRDTGRLRGLSTCR